MISDEKKTIAVMVRMYCRYKEGNRELCDDCRQLLEYAFARLDRCPFGDRKGSCRKCAIHCYAPPLAEKVRVVMRWAGPRMMLRHPGMALVHLYREQRHN